MKDETKKITQSLLAGIIGTAVMSFVMTISGLMGMPKMSPPAMLSTMMEISIVVGWVLHFMIGIIFAMVYAFFFIDIVRKISNKVLRGVIFGFAVFIFAQIMMAIMGMVMPIPPMEGSMLLIITGSIIGHIIFGITVALFVREPAYEPVTNVSKDF